LACEGGPLFLFLSKELTMINKLFVRALAVATDACRLTPQARIASGDDEMVFVWDGDKLFTLEKVGNASVALCDEDGNELRRWLV
jgi:hypothetical protein